MDWENKFARWGSAPSQTEQEKCDRTVQQIKKAIADWPALNDWGVETFSQGSYANRVNISQESDVDICCYSRKFYYFYVPPGETRDSMGVGGPSNLTYKQYKDEIEAALVSRFGRERVKRGGKAFDIHSNSYAVDADVVAAVAYRKYYRDMNGRPAYHEGTAIFEEETGNRFTNFPNHQYRFGVNKNEETSRQYKKHVRILKNLRCDMERNDIEIPENIASFLLESLCFNQENKEFDAGSLFQSFENLLISADNKIKSDHTKLTESNGIKLLFNNENSWTPWDVASFLQQAWGYTHR